MKLHCYREEKSLHDVAVVAKFLDEIKSKMSIKNWIHTVSNFIDLTQFHIICKILAKLSGVESKRNVSGLWQIIVIVFVV